MLKVLRMEFVFFRRQFAIIMAIFSVYFGWMVYSIPSPRVFLVLISLMIGLAMPFGILGREDKFKTASLVCSLPVRRSSIVLAKYAISWITIGIALVYSIVLTAVLPFGKVPVEEILNPKSLLISLAMISLFFSFILPFTTRFGLTGIIIFLVGTQMLGIVMLLLGQLLGRQNNPLRAFIRAVEGGFRSVLNHPSTPGFLLTLAAAILVLNAASFIISRALYARRDF